jgi:hypothetical protein
VRPFVLVALILAVGSASAAEAQSRRWRNIRGRPLVKFDSNCASPSAYPAALLKGLVQTVVKRGDYAGVLHYAGRAVAFDLNGDRRPEYFVPLVCGATGGCTWGLFGLRPSRFMGAINGQYLFVHARRGRWPDVITYGHVTAAEGTLETYAFRRGRYAGLGDVYHVGDEGRDSDVWNVPLREMPRFLERARPACERVGW